MGTELAPMGIRGAIETTRIRQGKNLAVTYEDARFEVERAKIRNAADLTQHAGLRLTQVHGLFSQLSHESPQLELELRNLQSSLAVGMSLRIVDYLQR
jgi:hypothetical protein